jgi:hypothetical protein
MQYRKVAMETGPEATARGIVTWLFQLTRCVVAEQDYFPAWATFKK